MATLTEMMSKLISANTASSSGSGTLPGNTVTNPKEDLKGITTRSGVAYLGPKTPSQSKQGTKVTKDQVQTPSSQSTAPVQPLVIQFESQDPVSEPVVAPVTNEQIEKFYEIFKEMSFEISFTDALILMPKFASTLKALIRNKEKLSEMARTTMNEHCSTVILNKLPKKLGDPGKFLIPCEFSGMDECLALADLGASINLMPLSVWEGLSLPELTPTCMTLELANLSVSKPIGIAKDVSFKVGVFHFPADFVVVDFEPDPRVPLILGRCFLKTSRAFIDVHKGELTLHIGNEAITYNLDQTVRYSANYNQMTANKIDVIESTCEDYSQEANSIDLSGVAYPGPKTPSQSKQRIKVTKDQVQPSVIQYESQDPVSEPVVAPVSAPMPNLKPSIPYPSRRDNEKHPLIGNKEKLSEMARTTMNEHCSVVILNKLPRKLGDPRKFLIPCEFSRMDECLALADLVSKPFGIAKDVPFKVGVFHFPADFVVVDFEPDPRVPLILGRCFLKTSRALIDVYKGELTLHIRNEAITYNLDQTVRYSSNYNQMTANKIDVVESACEEYSQEVLGFSNVTDSGMSTPQNDPIISVTSPTLTLFGDSDFLLFEEADAFLGLEDNPDSPKINPFYYDLKGGILLLEAILNSEPSPPPPNQEQNLPSFKEELKAYEAQTVKSSVDEPPEVELKDLPPHLEYAFLEDNNKFPVIIAKELGDEEKSALLKVLKSHKRA
nr:reverse transcriptase domain-containing protein [Tanacetum cinerariifolium]